MNTLAAAEAQITALRPEFARRTHALMPLQGVALSEALDRDPIVRDYRQAVETADRLWKDEADR